MERGNAADLSVTPTPRAFTITDTGTYTVSGNAVLGQTLTAGTSGLSSTPSVALGALTYQWKRGGADISGANASTYTPATDDIGKTITVAVTAAR